MRLSQRPRKLQELPRGPSKQSSTSDRVDPKRRIRPGDSVTVESLVLSGPSVSRYSMDDQATRTQFIRKEQETPKAQKTPVMTRKQN